MPQRVASTAVPSLAVHHEQWAFDRQLRDGRALLASMDIASGMRVLELDCGTGLLAGELADAVGERGEVLGLDPLALRVQIAHQRSRHNLRFQVGAAAGLSRLPAASFDAIVANGVLHGWPDLAGTLAQCVRLLAPDGRLGVSTYCAAHQHPAARVRDAVLAQPAYAGHAQPPEALARPVTASALDGLLRQAGFAAIALQCMPETLQYASPHSAIESMQASAWGRFLMHLPDGLRDAARAEVERRLDAMAGPHCIAHDAMRFFAVARKAPS